MSLLATKVDGISEGVNNSTALQNLTSSFLKSGEYSDLVLRCEGKDIKVHKLFVCSRSKPIAAAMSGRHQTCEPGVFELLDSEYDVALKMVDFMYTETYTPTTPKKNPEDAAIISSKDVDIAAIEAVKLYIMGDRYDLLGLKALAKKTFEMTIKPCGASSLLEILRIIYTELPDTDLELKKIALQHICAGLLIDTLLDSKEFKVFCDEIGGVGFDIMTEYRRSMKKRVKEEKERDLKEAMENLKKAVASASQAPPVPSTNAIVSGIRCIRCNDVRDCLEIGGGAFGPSTRYYSCRACGVRFAR